MLEVKNISKKFNDIKAVENVSFNIDKGEIVGFLGPNGAGKTTTMKMIAGLLYPDAGNVLFDGLDVFDNVNLKKHIGFMPENNPLYDDMLVSEFLYFSASLKGISKKDIKKEIDSVLKSVSIEDVYHRQIRDLSKGYRQRVGLAQAVMGSPKLLILDEPTEGLDPLQRDEIRELIKNIGEKYTVIISTHILQEVSLMCNRILVINKGKIVADDSVSKILSDFSGKTAIVLEVVNADISEVKTIKGVVDVKQILKQDNVSKFEITADGKDDIRPFIYNKSKELGWTILEMYKKKTDLETIFKDLTN